MGCISQTVKDRAMKLVTVIRFRFRIIILDQEINLVWPYLVLDNKVHCYIGVDL